MILICGAGTLGGNLAEQLARRGGRELAILDFDRVEEHNLRNQPYFTHQVGQPKVLALSQTLYQAGSTLKTIQAKLDEQNARKHLKNVSLVVDAFDNNSGRSALQAAVRALGIPCLHLGISRNGYGEAVWDEGYVVPPDRPNDPCAQETSRGLALLVTAMADRALAAYFETGERCNRCVTEEDLCVSAM